MAVILGFVIGALTTWICMKLKTWDKETKDLIADAGKPIEDDTTEKENTDAL